MIEVIISVLALLVATTSVFYAREQVKLAKKTKDETTILLEDINSKVKELKSLTGIIKQNVEDTVKELISNSNENFVKLLDKLPISNNFSKDHAEPNTHTVTTEDKLMETLLPGILEKAMDDPESFDKFMKNMEKFGKK